jgi:hypothetical protein
LSVGRRLLEPLDCELFGADADDRLLTFGTVTISLSVGNDDGGHHIAGISCQAHDDGNMTIPAGGITNWNGEAMHRTDYNDLTAIPDEMAITITMPASPPPTRPEYTGPSLLKVT